jgi:hypothetical protein
MRLALLTGCAATLSLIGAAAAQAETIYMNGPEVVTTEPAYTYSVPGPLPFSRFVVTEHAPVVVAEPPAAVIAAPRARVVVTEPRRRVVMAPRPAAVVNPPLAVVPRDSGIVTTGYSTVRSCFTDLAGIERCY